MTDKKFIKTSDLETKEKLLSLGYILISDNNNIATFLNEARAEFTELKKVAYSDILSI